jgi:hypothetical protein
MTIADALAAGLGTVAAWVGCARDVVRRLGGLQEEPAGHAGSATRATPADTDAQAQVEEAKYYLGRNGERPRPAPASEPVVDREYGTLPRAYGHDRIVALPRDPWWLYAYWEITPTTRVQALRTLGAEAEGTREVLRVYDVTFVTFTGDNAWQSFDVELPPGSDNWYLNVARPAASYCIEIGLRTPGGRFLPLARSNAASTPRSSPSPDTSVQWVELRRHGAARDAAGYPAAALRAAVRPLTDATLTGTGSSSSDVHAPLPAR